MLKWQRARLTVWSLTMILGFSVFTPAQKAIGAKSGVVQFSKGEVFLDGTHLQLAKGSHAQVENDQVLSTKRGYVELVLAPAAYLWLGENSSLRMRQNKLNDIQLEITQGSGLTYILQTIKFPINVHASKHVIEMGKAGLYRVDAVPGRLRVYSGNALVKDENKKTRIQKGRMIYLEAKAAPAKFDVKSEDALHRLALQRSTEIAVWMRHSQIEEAMRNVIRGLESFESQMQSQADQEVQRLREAERRIKMDRIQQQEIMKKQPEGLQQQGE
jgi:hypothetical protein